MKAAESIREPLPLDPSSSPPSVVAGPIRSQKISSLHFERLAVVYVRQSSAHQVLEHRESRTRQYALAEHAQFLGWPEERVLVIDDDQGLSGTTAQSRCGFQRLLAEVTMNHVGLVLALEMSRLARSCKDWHQLFELCGIFSTLLADQEGVYDANDPNDRLLLGLKGIMSEVELQTMRNRLYRGKLNKAQRGELFSSVPRGYVLLPTGEVALDPDEQGRSVVHLVFEKFEEIGSARGVFQWLARKKIDLPLRSLHGPRKGELRWQRPELSAVNKILHHPMYAGVYSFGRWSRKSKRSPSAAKLGHSLLLPIDQWQVLIRDHLPAYISWDQYQRNQERVVGASCVDFYRRVANHATPKNVIDNA
jgi:DNA invertase Pin-like site-specific DNA recombinase